MKTLHRINPIRNTLKRLALAGSTARIASSLAAIALTSMSAHAAPTVWNVNIGTEITTSDNYIGAAPENTASSTWNSFVTADLPNPKLLADSTGTSTAVTFRVTGSPSMPTIGTTGTSVGDEIFKTWLKGLSNTSDFTCTFANLTPGDIYDLVIYADWYWGGSAIKISQTAGTGLSAPFTFNFGNTTNNDVGPLREDTNPANVTSNPDNWNYTRFNTLTPNTSGNLAFLIDGGNWPIVGFQLVKRDLADTTAPTPDPMSWASAPAATGESSITMTATTASDPSGVEYQFIETSGNPGGSNSGWQNSPVYTDTGLTPNTSYTYTVTARDKSVAQNMTTPSDPASAVTDPADITPPTPDPMTFATLPTATKITKITMTATTASDPYGVEYYFTETSGNPGGSDSGWQDSPVYTDIGLTPNTSYTYTVMARDKSLTRSATAPSDPASATTHTPVAGEIVWSTPLNTTAATDVVTTGTLHVARHGDNTVAAPTITVNGVDFAPGPILNQGVNSNNCVSACPDELEALLDRFGWHGWTTYSFQITGLNPGQQYMIQVFMTDQRFGAPANPYGTTFGDGAGNTVVLSSGSSSDTTTFGQFVTGTFTAKADGTQTVETPLINAFQVRSATSGATPYDTWANGTFVPALTQKLPGDDQDGDSLTNLQEYAFGTQPTVSTGEIVYSGGTITTPGAPKIVAAGGTYSMVYGRLNNYVAAGLTYTVEFSTALEAWVDNDDLTNPPVQVATDGTINAMSVPYPETIETPSGPRKPTFSRVKVVLAP